MKKRKHRVVVEITMESALTSKAVTRFVQSLLSAGSIECDNARGFKTITKFTCKQFKRVVQGLPKYRRLRKFHRAVLYFLARPNATVKDTVYQLQCWVKQIKV